MLKLKLQYFGHLIQRADSLEKTLKLGKIKSRRRRGQQRMRWLDWHHGLNRHESEWNSRRQWWTWKPGVLQSMGLHRVRHDLATEQQQWKLKITLLTFQCFIIYSSFHCIYHVIHYIHSNITGGFYLLIEVFWYVSGKESTCRAGVVGSIWVWSLGWEDPLEKEMAAHSNILAWEIS